MVRFLAALHYDTIQSPSRPVRLLACAFARLVLHRNSYSFRALVMRCSYLAWPHWPGRLTGSQVSNTIMFDESGRIAGFTDPVYHVFNKTLVCVPFAIALEAELTFDCMCERTRVHGGTCVEGITVCQRAAGSMILDLSVGLQGGAVSSLPAAAVSAAKAATAVLLMGDSAGDVRMVSAAACECAVH